MNPGKVDPPVSPLPQAADETDRALERQKIAGRAGIVAAGTLTSRILGLGREQVLAAMFSRGQTDAFFIAFLIPNMLRQLLAEGASQNAVLPVLSAVREKHGDAGAAETMRSLRGLSLIILTLTSLLGWIFAPQLVDLFANGFRAQPGQYERTVTLTRWLFPYIFFMGSAALGAAALNTYRRFVVTSFGPALLNVSFIAFAILLPTWLGARGEDKILAMAFGALVGGALQLVVQWPSLHAINMLSWPRFSLSDPAVREVFRRMAPVMFGAGIYYIDVIIARRLLSDFEVGAQSYFAFAMRLCDFPQGIFVMAIQTATLPSLAALHAREDHDELAKTYAFSMRLALYVALGSTVMFVSLAGPIVRAVFERGQFDAIATQFTAGALVAQGVGIWLVAGVRQLVAVYFATGDTRTPVLISGIDMMAFVALALTLQGQLGHVGISWAISGASLVQLVLLWLGLRKKLPQLHLLEIGRCAVKTLAAALVAAAIAVPFATMLESNSLPVPLWAAGIVPGVVGCVLFVATFLAASRLLGSEELATIAKIGRRRGQAA